MTRCARFTLVLFLFLLIFSSCTDPDLMSANRECTLSISVCVDGEKATEMSGASSEADAINWTYTLVPFDGNIGYGAVPDETKMTGPETTVTVSHGSWKAEVWGYRDATCRELVYHGTGTGTVGRGGEHMAVSVTVMTDPKDAHAMNPADTPKRTADLMLAPIGLQGDGTGSVMKTAEWTLSSTIISVWSCMDGVWYDNATGLEIPTEGIAVEVPCGTDQDVTLTIRDDSGTTLGKEGWNGLTFAMNCVYEIKGEATARLGVADVSITITGINTAPQTSVKCGSYIESFFSIDPTSEMPSDNVAVIGYRIRKKGEPASVCSSDLTGALTYPTKLAVPGVDNKTTYTPSELGLTVIYTDSAEGLAASGAETAWVGNDVAFMGNLTATTQSSVKKARLISNTVVIREKMFYNNGSLEEIIIPEGVMYINDNAFQSCTSLRSVTIPSTVIKMKSFVFSGCASLEEVTFSAGVSSVPFYCFSDCTALKRVNLPESIKTIDGSAFRGCTSLSDITIPSAVTGIYASAFSGCTNLESVTIAEGSSLTTVGNYAFSNCRVLKDFRIPNSVTTLSQYAFQNCKALNTIVVPDSVTSMGNGVFDGCIGLMSVMLPGSVTKIGDRLFAGCSSLTSVTVPDCVTSIGTSAFSNCSSLETITIPDGIKSIGASAFNGCSSLSSITIPDSVTSIGNYAFSNCTSLAGIAIPDSVTSMGEGLLMNCGALMTAVLSGNATSVGADMFNGCSTLATVVIPDTVTAIGNNAFNKCASLAELTIPANVTSIGNWVFEGCTSLDRLLIDQPEGNLNIADASVPTTCTVLWRGQF